jgi:aspartate aminotransferase-like enzyme
MGESCHERNVLLCLAALEHALAEQGVRSGNSAQAAASASF